MATLYMYHGIPGSGKSTLARKKLSELDSHAKIVNMDSIRVEFFGQDGFNFNLTKMQDRHVAIVRDNRIIEQLEAGFDVISDDTNLNRYTVCRLTDFAENCGADVEHIYVNVPLDVAIERCKKRAAEGGTNVPEHVVRSFFKRSCDPDGTIRF